MIRFLVHRVRARSLLLAGCETALMIAAVIVAAVLRLGLEDAQEILLNDNGVFKVLLIVGIAQVSLYYADLYDLRIASDRRELYTPFQHIGILSLEFHVDKLSRPLL